MVDSLRSFSIDPVPEDLRTDAFKLYIETMLPVLINSPGTDQLVVTPSQGSIDAFDLTGFLLDNNISYQYHYIVMRMNGLNSVHAFDENTGSLLLPNWNILGELIQVYRSGLV